MFVPVLCLHERRVLFKKRGKRGGKEKGLQKSPQTCFVSTHVKKESWGGGTRG